MENSENTLLGEVIGNIIIVDDSAGSGNLLAYRQEGGQNALLGAFPYTEQGILVAYLFGAYLASMFPEGPINPETVEKATGHPSPDQIASNLTDHQAVDEINKLGLFSKPVELQ